jgi:hypothetical protein
MKEKKTNRFTSFDSNEKKIKRWNGWRDRERDHHRRKERCEKYPKKLNGGFSSHHSRQAI